MVGLLTLPKINQTEVWPRFQSLSKLLLWTKCVKWVKVLLKALGHLCLWRCLIVARYILLQDCSAFVHKKCTNIVLNSSFLFFIVLIRDAPLSKKCIFFEHFSKGLGPPPPFIWTFVLFCRGCFLTMLKRIWNICSSPHLKCCINVGVREAPCKKSSGILASYWTPPKIK